jgi:hypothetical protein
MSRAYHAGSMSGDGRPKIVTKFEPSLLFFFAET